MLQVVIGLLFIAADIVKWYLYATFILGNMFSGNIMNMVAAGFVAWLTFGCMCMLSLVLWGIGIAIMVND